MEQFTESIRQAVREKNWYAALALAPTLPDICGRLESPNESSTKRYVAWCKEYLQPKYPRTVGADHKLNVFLTGRDCYALRCAFLHEGRDDIVEQRSREARDSFSFITTKEGFSVHCNATEGKLQLQVDRFCLYLYADSSANRPHTSGTRTR